MSLVIGFSYFFLLKTPPTRVFDNSYGGFNADGSEYLISVHSTPGNELILPPAPWVNVIANPSCGFFVSESGSGNTWAGTLTSEGGKVEASGVGPQGLTIALARMWLAAKGIKAPAKPNGS